MQHLLIVGCVVACALFAIGATYVGRIRHTFVPGERRADCFDNYVTIIATDGRDNYGEPRYRVRLEDGRIAQRLQYDLN